jgi:cbb3-type cytochrome oxidase cytochrome c subunit
MNYGPLLFLAALFALASSWFGFVLTPQMQVGLLQQTNTIPFGATYPLGRPGLARQGLEVYRVNGCAYCHSQQVVQTGVVCDLMLNETGTNKPALLAALQKIEPGSSEKSAQEIISDLPKVIIKGTTKEAADATAKTLTDAGAKCSVWIVPVGPDISRGWGLRRSVAEDFLFDNPVMLGSQRIGPDLANVGARLPDQRWHLMHLYAPKLEVKGSSMPPYKFLFDERKIDRVRSSDALTVPPELARDGFEVVPKPEAQALVAYLLSLRADAPLFDAPVTVAPPPSAVTDTNAPTASGSSTNATAVTNAPAK